MISAAGAGATNRLQSNLPHLVISHDYCHALNLVIKIVIGCFPIKYTQLVELPYSNSSVERVLKSDPYQDCQKKPTQS